MIAEITLPATVLSHALQMTAPWWPLMRKRTHRRAYIKQGEAYRREIQEARQERDRARAQLQSWVDSLVPHADARRDFPSGNLLIALQIEGRVLERMPTHGDLFDAVRESITRGLLQASHDYRGDLRQTDAQRLLGL